MQLTYRLGGVRLQSVKPPSPASAAMALVNPHAAALDIGLAEIGAAVPPASDPQSLRKVETFMPARQALAEWLRAGGVTPVAMESTAVYWIPRRLVAPLVSAAACEGRAAQRPAATGRPDRTARGP